MRCISRLSGGLVAAVLMSALARGQSPPAQEDTGLSADEAARVAAAAALLDATVQVTVLREHEGSPVSTSGIVWDGEGRVVTSASRALSGGVQRIAIIGPDGRELPARTIGQDPETDVALLQVEGGIGTPLPRGRAADLQLGRTVLGMGNPFGLRGSLVPGMVSGVDRTLVGDGRVFAGMVQTTAPFNPGDTGGPVVDSSGHLIGMIFSTYGRSPSALNDRIEERLRWIESNRQAVRSLKDDLRSWWSKSFGEEDSTQPATEEEKAALDAAIDSVFDGVHVLARGVEQYGLGFLGKDLDFLGAQGIAFVLPVEQIEWVVSELVEHGAIERGFLGVTVAGTGAGARVARVQAGGPAAKAGLQEGDVVAAFDGKPIRDADGFHSAVSFTRPGEEHTLQILRAPTDGEETTVTLVVVMGSRPAR